MRYDLFTSQYVRVRELFGCVLKREERVQTRKDPRGKTEREMTTYKTVMIFPESKISIALYPRRWFSLDK